MLIFEGMESHRAQNGGSYNISCPSNFIYYVKYLHIYIFYMKKVMNEQSYQPKNSFLPGS